MVIAKTDLEIVHDGGKEILESPVIRKRSRGVRRGLRHEVAGMIVWRDTIPTRPAVPSVVPYEVRRRGNGPSKSPRTTYPPPSGGHWNREGTVHRQASCGAGPGWMAWLTHVNSR